MKKRTFHQDGLKPSILAISKGTLLLFIPIILFISGLYVIYKNTVWFGSSTHTQDFHGPNEGITLENNIAAKEYNSAYNLFYTRATGSEINVNTKIPYGQPKQATVDVVYQNPTQNAFIIQLPSQNAEKQQNIIIEHPVIEYLKKNKAWTEKNDPAKNLTLFMKQKSFSETNAYTSIDEFLQQPPTEDWVQTFSYPLEQSIDNTPEERNLSYDVAFRGETKILLSTKTGQVQFKIFYEDSNLSDGEDPIIITLNQNGVLKKEESFPDDGNTIGDGKKSERKNILFATEVQTPGVYDLDITANTDIRMKGITTPHAFVFDKNITLDDGSRPKTIVILGNNISAATSHVKSLQTIQLNGNEIVLKKTNTDYATNIPHEPLSVSLEKADVTLTTDGIIGLTEGNIENFGRVQPLAATLADFLTDKRVAYVLVHTPAVPSVSRNGWTRTRFTITDLPSRHINQNLTFLIELPAYEKNESFKIREITTTYSK